MHIPNGIQHCRNMAHTNQDLQEQHHAHLTFGPIPGYQHRQNRQRQHGQPHDQLHRQIHRRMQPQSFPALALSSPLYIPPLLPPRRSRRTRPNGREPRHNRHDQQRRSPDETGPKHHEPKPAQRKAATVVRVPLLVREILREDAARDDQADCREEERVEAEERVGLREEGRGRMSLRRRRGGVLLAVLVVLVMEVVSLTRVGVGEMVGAFSPVVVSLVVVGVMVVVVVVRTAAGGLVGSAMLAWTSCVWL